MIKHIDLKTLLGSASLVALLTACLTSPIQAMEEEQLQKTPPRQTRSSLLKSPLSPVFERDETLTGPQLLQRVSQLEDASLKDRSDILPHVAHALDTTLQELTQLDSRYVTRTREVTSLKSELRRTKAALAGVEGQVSTLTAELERLKASQVVSGTSVVTSWQTNASNFSKEEIAAIASPYTLRSFKGGRYSFPTWRAGSSTATNRPGTPVPAPITRAKRPADMMSDPSAEASPEKVRKTPTTVDGRNKPAPYSPSVGLGRLSFDEASPSSTPLAAQYPSPYAPSKPAQKSQRAWYSPLRFFDALQR